MNSLTEFTGSTMDSREIAGLTGKRHERVLNSIRKMLTELGEDEHKFVSVYIDDHGQERPC